MLPGCGKVNLFLVPMPPSPKLPSFLSTYSSSASTQEHKPPGIMPACFCELLCLHLQPKNCHPPPPIKGIKKMKVSLREDPSCFSREGTERAKMVSLPLRHSDNETTQHHPESLQGRRRACPRDHIPSVVDSGRHRQA